jgi:uncharacterized protein (TIGR02145 family)
MKYFIATVISIVMFFQLKAQSPNQIQYQAVIRNATGQVLAGQAVGMRVSIIKGSATGTAVYVETHRDTTTNSGLVTLEIGLGTVVTGSFAAINWGQGPYFIKTESDISGGTNYQLAGTTQLMSVPYSMYSNDVASSLTSSGDTLVIGKRKYYIPGIKDVTTAQTAFVCGSPITFTYRGSTVTYGTVEKNYGGTVGKKCWLDRNLGAIRVATSVTDYQAYGDLFQWGRGDDGHQVMNWTNASTGTGTTVVTGPNSNDNPGIANWIHISNNSPYDWRIPQNNSLWQGVNGKNNPCPTGWRLPEEAEWVAERASWSSSNASGAFSSALKLTLTGGKEGTGIFFPMSNARPGSQGGYWASTVAEYPSLFLAKCVIINTQNSELSSVGQRHGGFSVRCIKD